MAARAVPIGEYEPQVPVQEGLRRIIPEQNGASIGPALEDIGNAAQTVARSEAARYSTEQLGKSQSDWTQQFIDRQQNAAPGAPNFTPTLMKDFNDYVGKAVKGAPNQLSGKFLQQQLAEFGHQLAQKSMLFEANARQDHNEETAKTSIESTGNELMNDPSLYNQRLAERQFAVSQMNMEPQVKEKLNQYATTSMAKFAVQGDIQRDPYQAMLKLQNQTGRQDLSDLQAKPGSPGTDTSQWQKRPDGTQKGQGWLGLLRRPDGGVSSEISIGVELNGKERDIPLLVPSLKRSEVDKVLSLKTDENFNQNLPDSIKQKAVAFARQRIAQGKDPFASAAESPGQGASYYQSLTPELRDSLMDNADRMLHQRVADAERVHNLAKQQQSEASDNLLKQGILMSQKGSLTPEWIASHVHTLEPAAMKYLFDEASGKKTDSDLHLYSELLTRQSNGEDVRDDANDGLYKGLLSKEDYTRLVEKSGSEIPTPYKRGMAYISTAGKTSELEPDPAKTQTLANMQNDFQDWTKSHPQADADDVQNQAISIVKRYQLVRSDQNLLTLPVPQIGLGKGTRATPDLPGAKRDLKKALDEGTMSRDDFNRQALLLQQWQSALDASTAAKTKAKPP